ncbi:ATP synthase F1 subunit epsilon [Candidatus Peregrinibacteria bacterium]|nr:ATP synthase F1 subunit epsilon [Candidatus Peregrinibacteria bacterium]
MFDLNIITVEKNIFTGRVSSVIVPTVTGEIGILTDHHPLIAKLDIGAIKIILEDNSERTIFMAGGFLEVHKNKVAILADLAENLENIALEEASAARKKAETMVTEAKDAVTAEKLKEELRIVMMREKLAQMSKYKK